MHHVDWVGCDDGEIGESLGGVGRVEVDRLFVIEII